MHILSLPQVPVSQRHEHPRDRRRGLRGVGLGLGGWERLSRRANSLTRKKSKVSRMVCEQRHHHQHNSALLRHWQGWGKADSWLARRKSNHGQVVSLLLWWQRSQELNSGMDHGKGLGGGDGEKGWAAPRPIRPDFATLSTPLLLFPGHKATRLSFCRCSLPQNIPYAPGMLWS